MKILVADSVSERAVEILREQESWDVVFLPKKAGAKVADEIRDADALVVRSATKVTAQLLASAGRLRVIGRAGTGVDNVDLAAATEKGVVVMNTPGGNAQSVAEHTMALLLALARRIPQADASMKQGHWEKKKLEGMELRGKTLGLIGLGQIGAAVASLAKAFEMRVVAYDPYVSSLLAGEQAVKLVSLEEVLKAADFISLHASSTPETRHLINARTLALAQPGVRIVNCARGELVNEADLLAALESGLVAGAGLDVFEVEPPKDSKLAVHPSVIATPHIAGSTEEAQEIVGIRIAEQVRDYLISGVARNAVNMPAVSPEEFKKLEPYIQLAEKLGAFLAQLAGERIREVRISYDGGLAELNTHLVKNAVLKGILTPALSQQVNLINAGASPSSAAWRWRSCAARGARHFPTHWESDFTPRAKPPRAWAWWACEVRCASWDSTTSISKRLCGASSSLSAMRMCPASSAEWAPFSATARSISPPSPWDATRKPNRPSVWSMSIIRCPARCSRKFAPFPPCARCGWWRSERSVAAGLPRHRAA